MYVLSAPCIWQQDARGCLDSAQYVRIRKTEDQSVFQTHVFTVDLFLFYTFLLHMSEVILHWPCLILYNGFLLKTIRLTTSDAFHPNMCRDSFSHIKRRLFNFIHCVIRECNYSYF